MDSVTELAARALGHLDGDGQVLVVRERRIAPDGVRTTEHVTFTALADGRSGSTRTDRTSDEGLGRAARQAARFANGPRGHASAGLPAEAAPAPAHEGADPALFTASPQELGDALRLTTAPGIEIRFDAMAAEIAVLSTAGVRAHERRTCARVQLVSEDRERSTRSVRRDAVAVSPAGIDVGALMADALAHLELEATTGEGLGAQPRAVLAPAAVGGVLGALRSAFGVDLALGGGALAGRAGTRVAAPAVNLSDSSRYPGTLPRSFDAEGVPRRPVPLIQDGVAHRAVHDTATAARAGEQSTGHATQAAIPAAMPEHLVLVGGGAASLEELCAPVGDGVLIDHLYRSEPPDRWLAEGVRRIRDGRVTGTLNNVTVEVDALGVLAAVEALTSAQQLVALTAHTPGGIGAAVVPGIRIAAGAVRLAP